MKSCTTCQGSYPNNYAICPADGSPLQDTGTWADGSIIRGKYQLIAKVGQGGMYGGTFRKPETFTPNVMLSPKATIVKGLGLDPMAQNLAENGRPIRLVDPKAKPIVEVLA